MSSLNYLFVRVWLYVWSTYWWMDVIIFLLLMSIFIKFKLFLLQVYLSLCCALIASAAGAYLHIIWNIGGLLTTLGCMGSIIWLLSTPSHEEVGISVFDIVVTSCPCTVFTTPLCKTQFFFWILFFLYFWILAVFIDWWFWFRKKLSRLL